MPALKTMLMCVGLFVARGQEGPQEPQPECRKMKEIYASGREICENMWSGAFKYEEDEDNAYTMWFFDAHNNPNDVVTRRLARKGVFEQEGPVDQCYLQYYHKGDEEVGNEAHPEEEPDTFQECHPWAQRSCCKQDTVSSVKKIKESYGPEFHWDRCGPMSQACERFFVMEACFYECEPNAGLFRKHKDSAVDPDPFGGSQPLHDDPECVTTNAWQMHQMPIKASFCDAWYNACKEDYFCGANDGDYFQCAKQWEPFDIIAEQNRLPGSCKHSCNGKSKTGPCRCDSMCSEEDPITCCADFGAQCEQKWVAKPFGSCADSCGGSSNTPQSTCWCDKECLKKGDCCEDINDTCANLDDKTAGSCKDSCGGKSKKHQCYCDKVCVTKGDCCSDRDELCPEQAENQPCATAGDC